jgi:hypothetical protein
MSEWGKVIFMEDIQKTYAMVIGGVLAAVGVLGFFNNPILGLFAVNTLHNIVHLLSGGLGLWLANSGKGQMFNQYFGIAYTVIAVLGFIPVTAGILSSVLAITMTDTVLHAALGLISLGIGYGVKA